MMEGLNQLGQEEYIWAMRVNAARESDTDWLRRQSMVAKKSKHDVDEHQTKVMASLVPDEVIYNVNDYRHRQYEACFLFGDVSGFTELCEKYTKTGLSGPSRMTQVLNKYLGSMVQEVLSHSGDVLKFSGDAFLAVFKTTESETMRDAVHDAIDCALVIQKDYGSYLTDVGVVIRVKLAISAGLVTFALIGEVSMSHYVVVGQPIWDVKAAERISIAGDIVVAPPAWAYVNTSEYLYEDMSDNVHVKITGVGANWRSVQKNVRQKKDSVDESLNEDEDSSGSDDLSVLTVDVGADEYSIRPAVSTAVRLKIKEAMRRFIIRPVMKSIDANEPFEYLTEMRQAVIVFINVISLQIETKETVILADQTYKVVCRVVEKMKGCVNKVSLFDKDLMFVVIFGLRGLKHELECQVALRCAKECHTAITQLPGVLSTSIGVTTGKTYCGIFGHTLRREYTVISLIVNKAARLMVAYQGKVTCDRNTFLHSKLEARHFILQEYKYLKGISHPGPVYEFREADLDQDVGQQINACPLLGRTKKLQLYHKLLTHCQDTESTKKHHKMLLITGEARIGKTRLLDELVYVTPPEIQVNKFTLTKKDYKIPYQAIRLIFNVPLALTTGSKESERQDKLLRALKTIKNEDMYCVLNEVFAVSFRQPKVYLAMKEPDRKKTLEAIMKQLASACFVKLRVLIIDDSEFVDDFSWEILKSLLSVKTIFVVGTIGREQLNSSKISLEAHQNPLVKAVYLRAIERMYLGALACQILDVFAISPELENAIQVKSNGNPGWIESYLISLIQDQSLYILKANLSQINDLGLVSPPLYMMARLTEGQTRRWQEIMEEKRPSASLEDRDTWQRYIDCCRDNYLNISVREEMETIPSGGKVPICVISPNFIVGDDEMELSMDAIILKTFDSLDCFEQLLVKCSAILGIQFLRDMLLYVMSSTDTRKAAIAVQKLFEIKVLTCAKGDFLEGGSNVLKEKLLNPNEEPELKCHCRGIRIEDNCADLPKYASCGYLQFRSSQFRDITFNLLTDNQKKEFHQRAINYLERETRKCRACGNGFFDRILGVKQDKEFLTVRNRRKQISVGAWDDGSQRTSLYSGSLTSGSAGGSGSLSVSGINRKTKYDDRSMGSPSTIMRHSRGESITSFGIKSRASFGMTVIKKLKSSFGLTRAFSTEDFMDCQCNLILTTTYAQLIDHCTGAGDTDKVIQSMLEFAKVCITTSNIPLAMTTLDEALEVVRQKSHEKLENAWKLSMIRARIYMLIGYSRLELGHLEQAHGSLHLALREYDITFPTGLSKQMRICKHLFKQLFGFYVFPGFLLKNLDHWHTVYANDLSECLAHLCNLYTIRDEWANAQMAAAWSLSKCLESFSDFRMICTASANMISIAQHFGRWNLCIAVEVYSLRLCHLKKTAVDAEDLKCVAKLYGAIFITRVTRSEMEKAIHMGYIALRLCSSIHAVQIILPLLPLMLQALLMAQHFNNAYSILQELNYFAGDDTDSTGKVWYHALCVGVQLETGYTVVPYNVCENFYQLEGQGWLTIRDPDARRRFVAVMWLWCVRNEQWEAAGIWCLKTNDLIEMVPQDSVANKITSLYILEGLIIFLVCKLDRRNIGEVSVAEREINELFKEMDKAAQTSSLILPRLYHLKAYYRFVKKNDAKVAELLNKAAEYAVKQENTYEIGWMEHSRKAWSKGLSPDILDFWKDHSEVGNLLDFQEIELGGKKIGYYTLPTPLYA